MKTLNHPGGIRYADDRRRAQEVKENTGKGEKNILNLLDETVMICDTITKDFQLKTE